MALIIAIFIGLLIGLVAKFLMPGRDGGGFFITALLGIAGSLLASYLGAALGWYRHGETAGFLGSVVGAMILLALYRMVRGNPRRT